MGKTAVEIRTRLNRSDYYEGFDYRSYPHELRGGVITPTMSQVFNALRPRVIVEVGSWMGRSACFWASLMRQNNIDGAVICVDTWLGGIEHIEKTNYLEWDIRPFLKNGYPQLYHQFLANVMHEGLQEYIVPLPATSLIAARYLTKLKLNADLIYVDASHDEDDVYQDLCAFWRVLRGGGVYCGDDFRVEWYSVICGVNRFAREYNLNLQVAMPTWLIQKPSVTPPSIQFSAPPSAASAPSPASPPPQA